MKQRMNQVILILLIFTLGCISAFAENTSTLVRVRKLDTTQTVKKPKKKPETGSESTSSTPTESTSSSTVSSVSTPVSTPVNAPSRSSTSSMGIVAGAALAGVAIATSLYKSRQTSVETMEHPLNGSLQKRINKFEKFSNFLRARPKDVEEESGSDFNNMSTSGVVAV
mmetsp:Transcript_1338/g.1927  ORF Transcript_1338/g.1927 Transcript_1338/m.1927 type:complete len:168 (+) Transcript_1338:211-714(+)|eukprot:CAMPEP_0184855780 /NCGR_PEP_ID=MMETSP0580-20130426/925_1 /TAXON_ID=1118495 /ORGANISM="Dactyliosolen fragilissimus" /LENGTH=167 /DNA_ID=CAMNT_0027350389 /DNA_START=129 /DNA_END=632 /DNA_ORIENTATION=+